MMCESLPWSDGKAIHMSIKIMNAVWQNAEIDGRRLLLLLALADNCNDDGMCYPKIPYLAQKTRQSERNVQYSMRFLENEGLVRVAEDESGFVRYFLNVEKLLEGGAKLAPGGARSGKSLTKGCTPGVQGLVKTGGSSFIEPSIEPSLEPKISSATDVAGVKEPLVNLNDIAEIYKTYPKHLDRGKAYKAIAKALKRLEDGENGRKLMYCDAVLFLLEAVQQFANSPAGKKGQFTAYPASWMNNSSYLDDRTQWGKLEGLMPKYNDPGEMTAEEVAWAEAWNRKERARIGAKR